MECCSLLRDWYRQYFHIVDETYSILCDYGDGPEECLYGDLIDSLVARHRIKHNFQKCRVHHYVVIHGITCRISFFGSHYCGYVEDNALDVLTDDDYEPHGGWTGGWGFDCAHAGDITLGRDGTWAPYRPYVVNSAYGNSTFKTYEYVYNELEKVTMDICKRLDAPRIKYVFKQNDYIL